MKENNNKSNQPSQLDMEPGNPNYNPGNTATPQQEVYDEDAKAEQEYEKNQPKAADEEDNKVVNEQEQDQVVNDDEHPEESTEPSKEKKKGPAKMSETVNEQDLS